MTRQRQWQLKMQAAGLCITCAEPRNKYSHRCDKCHLHVTLRQRERVGHKPWKPGGVGRPPLGSDYEPRTTSGKRYRKQHEHNKTMDSSKTVHGH
jgi:hypothetical protein